MFIFPPNFTYMRAENVITDCLLAVPSLIHGVFRAF